MDTNNYDIIIVTGPTASGKTALAARLAFTLGSEVISADSRQVYRGMDIGTGKDYSDYIVDGEQVKSHLLDIADPGYKYNVYEYQRDFLDSYTQISSLGMLPIVCGGSGMYIDSIVSGYTLIKVPLDNQLRKKLEKMSMDELNARLSTYKKLHNRSDTDNRKRTIRAIEIEEYYLNNKITDDNFPDLKALIIGIKYDRDSRRRRISTRLKARLDEGMVDEAKALIDKGVSTDDLIYYGLEYKYLALYLTGEISYKQMFEGLETAIHQFAKRQMTWFRGMERKGIKIHWLDGYTPMEEKIDLILSLAEGKKK
jgi:tRNA dimethylallyltransferase